MDQQELDVRKGARMQTTHRCAQCFGGLRLVFQDDRYQLVCSSGCRPGGYVTAEYVDLRRKVDAVEAAEVAAHYPGLAGPRRSQAEIKADLAALFGEEA